MHCAWTILYHVCLLICTCLAFELVILFQFTSNTTTSHMHPTPTKLAEDGITAYTFSANSTRKLACFGNHSSIFTTNDQVHLLNIYSQP